jgi:hypothetical protein
VNDPKTGTRQLEIDGNDLIARGALMWRVASVVRAAAAANHLLGRAGFEAKYADKRWVDDCVAIMKQLDAALEHFTVDPIDGKVRAE